MIEMARRFRVFFVLSALLVVPGLARAQAEGGEAAADLERGEALFVLCTQCHGTEGQGNPDIEAPAIAGLPFWYADATLKKFKAGGRGTHIDDLSGMRMRPMSMSLRSDEDIAAVSAYVASLPPVNPTPLVEGGDATRGQPLYATCIACHMPDGSGNAALNAPPLKYTNDWYMLSQLQKFKSGVRGNNPLDPFGALMVGMAQTLVDEQAMKDVVAYIVTLSD